MRFSRISPLGIALLLATITFHDCRAGIIRHDRDAAKYRALGEQKAFESVGKITFDVPPDEADGFRPSASAVLIAPQWVLTANHVAQKKPLASQGYTFGDQVYRAVRVIPRPGFRPYVTGNAGAGAAISGGADVALVRLDRPVKGIKPAVRYRGKDEVGRIMTKIGYGCIGDGKAGMSLPLKQDRRGGNNVIDAAGGKFKDLTVSESVLACDFDNPDDGTNNQLGDAKPVDLEIGLSVGDSGCGWFIQEDGEWKLVAIHSGLLPNQGEQQKNSDCKYGQIFAGMRISTSNDWIDAVLAEPETESK